MKEYSNKTVIDSLDLPAMISFDDLTKHLRLSPNLVYWLTSDSEKKYRVFQIAKRNGAPREISAPVYSLNTVQRWVLNNILYKIKVSPYSYGFIKDGNGSPIVKCAEKHKNNLYILKMDIKNFYPSIKRERIYFKFTNIGYNSSVANLLTNICVFKDSLPQGAVTSSYLANIICRKMDYRIAGYCNKRDIVFSRYADDLTFSSDNREVLKGIYGTIKKIVASEGFAINEEKTRFLSPRCRKRVLGVTINDSNLKAPKETKRTIRAMIYNSFLTKDYSKNPKIKGYISYINSIEPNYKEKVKKYILSLYDCDYTIIKDVVDAFNSNKLFSDLPDMKTHKVEELFKIDVVSASEIESDINIQYVDFLASHGMHEESKTDESITTAETYEQDSPF